MSRAKSLMLSLQPDMSIPKDIDAVWIEISKFRTATTWVRAA